MVDMYLKPGDAAAAIASTMLPASFNRRSRSLDDLVVVLPKKSTMPSRAATMMTMRQCSGQLSQLSLCSRHGEQ
jgi:hypothetical protein